MLKTVECPSYLNYLPGCSVDIWKYLKDIGYPSNCNSLNCSKCIPPNSADQKLNKIHQLWRAAYKQMKHKRLLSLSNLLFNHNLFPISIYSDSETNPESLIILMVINEGYGYLFLNWVCSLDYHHLSHVRNHTLIIPGSSAAEKIAKNAGFNIFFSPHSWLPKKISNNLKSSKSRKAAQGFGWGAHKSLVALQMITLSDLIELGYHVLMLDSDIIWKRDVFSYAKYELLPLMTDVWMSSDPRWDILGRGNSGTILMRSNCKTRAMMHQMMKYISTIFKVSDQATFNFWLNWKPFREISFQILNPLLFIGGWSGDGAIVPLVTTAEYIAKNVPDFYMIHAFGAFDHLVKIVKFHQVNHWYFTIERCPKMFNDKLLPDIKDRQLNKFDPTSYYLLENKLIRNTLGLNLTEEAKKVNISS